MMKEKEEKRVPQLRFPEFTDDWEQRKLGEVATYRRGSFPQPYGKSEWYDGDGAMPFVQVADVSDEMNLVENTKQKISILAQPMSVFAEINSVLVTLQGSIGRVAITQYGAFVDRTVLIFEKYKAEIDKTFWAYIIKQKFIDEARKAPGGTIKTITKEALSDFDLSIPNYQEQKQIGAYFRNLDHLITLHQRKLEKLKKLKKGLVQKLFSQEVRFKADDGSEFPEWEEKKLGELGTFIKGAALSKADISEYGSPFILYGELYTTYKEVAYNIQRRTQAIVDKKYYSCIGDVVIPTSGESAEEISTATCVMVPNVILGGDLNIFRSDIVDGRIMSYILNHQVKWKIAMIAQGKSIVHIQAKQLSNIYVKYPVSKVEQQKIADCLSLLDDVIEKQKVTLAAWEEMKKGLLQQMFV
ncbi:restriction endonuclease subunit S [Lachnoclostridium sp. 210928-DFI.6.3]|nr:restriction endonuclease subunit S [Lachnoclostridium sp. 210928-DFI.6.3]